MLSDSTSRIERVVLVDAADRAVGTEEKLAAHRAGVLHRAFSIVVRNSRGELLMQRRALGKYHSGGLWSNACCGHPRPGESVVAAGERRLREEMGVSCALSPHAAFVYRAAVDDTLVEHEFDHVLVGVTDADPAPDPAEAMSWEWIEPDALAARVAAAPECFTAWLPLVLARLD